MREMKDSGIAWIGEIPNDWKVGRIKYYVSKVGSGKTPKGDNNLYTEGNVLFLRSQNIYDTGIALDFPPTVITDAIDKEMSNTRVVKDDVLLNITGGSIGRCCIYNLNEKANVNQHVSIIRAKKNKMFPEYMHYFWISNLGQNAIQLYQTGGNREGMSAIAIKNTPIPVISLSEQKMIVDYLDSKCADIDSLAVDIQNQIEILKEYKKSVITQAVTKGIDPNVKMKDTVSPYWNQIPMNWYLSDIKYVFEIVKRIAGKEGYDILSVTQKGLKIKDISHNEGQIAENYKGYQFVYPGDFVMNHMDLLTGWVDLSKLFGVTSPDYRVFKLIDNHVNEARYYKYVMQCCYSCRIFYSLGQGVSTLGRWRLQTSAFNNFLIPVSPIKEQLKIADFLDTKCAEIDAAIAGKQKQLDVLKEYKKSLIYEYVTGKKEVPCRE